MSTHPFTRMVASGLLATAVVAGAATPSQSMPLPVTSVQEIAGAAPTENVYWRGYVSGCETSLALAITRRALGKTEGLLGGLWRGLTSSGAAERRSWTTLSGDRPFRTRWRRAL